MKSEIRQSTIKNLLERTAKKRYSHYLLKSHVGSIFVLFVINRFHLIFRSRQLSALTAGVRRPSWARRRSHTHSCLQGDFSRRAEKYDSSMQDWAIEYDILDRTLNANDSFRRTASFKSSKWNRDAIARPVQMFGINRTVPANERKEFLKLATSKFTVPDDQIEQLPATAVTAINRILGRDAALYKRLKISLTGDEFFLTGTTAKGDEYSEFHFGAGESSIIRMVSLIELAPEESLILIEELENGLLS